MRANAGQRGPSHRGGRNMGGTGEGPPPLRISDNQGNKLQPDPFKKRGVAYLWGRAETLYWGDDALSTKPVMQYQGTAYLCY